MVDEVIPSAPVVTATAAEPAAPVASPVVDTPPVVAPAPEPVVVPVEPVPVAETTLLSGEKPKETAPKDAEAKPADAKPETPEAKEPPQVTEAPVPPVFEDFALPDGITIDSGKIGEFTNALAEFETTTKASHEEVQKFGQSLIDRHIEGIKESQTLLLNKLIEDGKKERDAWKDSFLKSPEFANRTDIVLNSALDAIGIYGGTAEQQQEFRELMQSTGVGNHPAMIRMLSNMMIAKPEPKQLAAPTIAKAVPKSQMQKRYGNK